MNIYMITFLTVLLLSGCATTARVADSDKPGDELQRKGMADVGSPTARRESGSEMAEQSEAGEPLAIVNGTEITINEYNDKLKQMSAFERARYRGEEGHRLFLNMLIQRELMVQKAKELGLDKGEEVQKKIEALMQEVTERVLMEALVKQEVLDKVVITDQEAKAYYDEHEEEFKKKEQVKLRHILVATEEEAQKIRQELEEGADFAKLASEKSTDENAAKRGGDLGYLERGKMPAEFERVCSDLEVGEIGDPVKTRFGYHIIRLEDRKEASTKELYEVSDEIKKKLISDKQRKEHQKWLRQLEKEAKIELKESFGERLVEPL